MLASFRRISVAQSAILCIITRRVISLVYLHKYHKYFPKEINAYDGILYMLYLPCCVCVLCNLNELYSVYNYIPLYDSIRLQILQVKLLASFEKN